MGRQGPVRHVTFKWVSGLGLTPGLLLRGEQAEGLEALPVRGEEVRRRIALDRSPSRNGEEVVHARGGFGGGVGQTQGHRRVVPRGEGYEGRRHGPSLVNFLF